jgi:hypothetical protein
MKKSIIFLILMLLLSGCVGVAKERVYRAADNSTLTLYPDNQFTIFYAIDKQTWTGAYQIRGDSIVCTVPIGIAITFTQKENSIIDQYGETWQQMQ